MSGDETERVVYDYYRSITPTDAPRVEGLVASAIAARRRRPSVSWLSWPAGGVVALAIAVIAVIAVGVLPLVAPSQPLAAPSLGTTTTSLPLPTGTTTPSATAVVSASPWKTLVASTGAGAAWSPDGAYVAVWSVNDAGASQNMQLLDRRGTLVRSLAADRFVWLDARDFVLVRGGSGVLGSVETDAVSSVTGSFSGDLLSSHHGAITSMTADPNNPSGAHFVVWTSQGVTQPINGRPVAWSSDGSKIAVWRPKPRPGAVGIGYQDTGTMDILAWPSLATVGSVPDESLVAQPTSFDPTGRYLLVSRLGLGGSFVMDLETGKTVGPASIGGSDTTGIVWGSEGRLLVASNDGSIVTYHIPDTASVRQPGLGDLAESTANGSTIVLAFTQDYSATPRPITLVRGDSLTKVAVPGGLVGLPALSDDGSGVVVFCLVDHGRPTEHTEALLLVG